MPGLPPSACNDGFLPLSDTAAATASRILATAATSAGTTERVMDEGGAGWDTEHGFAIDIGLDRLNSTHKTAC